MIPLVDMHCHLLAGLDDGPRTQDEALAMCRMHVEQGVGASIALAHQNDQYPDVSKERILGAAGQLAALLRENKLPLMIAPGAEVMVHPQIDVSWEEGKLLSFADRQQYLLIEMPHGLCVDLRDTVFRLSRLGIRPILAHPEQSPELLHGDGAMEDLVQLGCVVQVSSGSITNPRTRQDAKRLKDWFRRGIAHVLGSDGHSPTRRPPLLAAAYNVVTNWIGPKAADRVGSLNGTAILQGLPLRLALPERPRLLAWLPRWIGA